MKKHLKIRSFTLLELIIVIIILGILAILGFMQYGRMIERSRGAEARSILGDMRKLAYAFQLEHGTLTGLTAGNLNLGTNADNIPSTCTQASHFFSYGLGTTTANTTSLEATRCRAGGKTPACTGCGAVVPLTGDINLGINTATGADLWGGTGQY